MARVGDHFVVLTGGRASLESRAHATVPLGFLALACTLGDETLRVRGSVFRPATGVTPSSVAVQITYAFDRRPRVRVGDGVTELPMQDLEDLERLTVERVRRYGADVLGSLTADADAGLLRPSRDHGPATPA